MRQVLDENPSWKGHVEYVSRKVSRRLGLLSRIRSCLTLEASKQVYTTLAAIIRLCWCCVGRNLRGVLQRVTPSTEACSSNYITEEHLKWHFLRAKLVKSIFQRKMHKCMLVFKCLNNIVPRYLTQYFTRNADLHDYATRRSNDLHPPKPKRNVGEIKELLSKSHRSHDL